MCTSQKEKNRRPVCAKPPKTFSRQSSSRVPTPRKPGLLPHPYRRLLRIVIQHLNVCIQNCETAGGSDPCFWLRRLDDGSKNKLQNRLPGVKWRNRYMASLATFPPLGKAKPTHRVVPRDERNWVVPVNSLVKNARRRSFCWFCVSDERSLTRLRLQT